MPAWPRAVDILTHWAIAQNLRPTSPEARSALLNQEVALPFQERGEALVEEVLGLLKSYWELMEKGEIPPLKLWHEDHAELPLLQEGETTWVGVAGRVYRKALEGAWGIRLRVRLAFLRSQKVVEFPPDD